MRQPKRPNAKPSLEDYKKLVAAYQKLGAAYDQQKEQLHQYQEQINIKDSALQQQTEDIKRLDAEMVWTRAALEQAQKSIDDSESLAAKDKDDVVDGEWQERYARLKAETENLRKRWEQRSKDQLRDERNRILLDMLPLADHLEMALKHIPSDEIPEDKNSAEQKSVKKKSELSDCDLLLSNIQATFDAFISTLKRYDVEPINAHGQPFDPNLHEAIGRISSDDVPSDHVAEVMQTGYIDGEKLLRPARVMVSE